MIIAHYNFTAVAPSVHFYVDHVNEIGTMRPEEGLLGQ
jgi:hypothetical protein